MISERVSSFDGMQSLTRWLFPEVGNVEPAVHANQMSFAGKQGLGEHLLRIVEFVLG